MALVDCTCPRCGHVFVAGEFYGPCSGCTEQLRTNAALDGQAIAAVFDPDDDHRSPGERLRED